MKWTYKEYMLIFSVVVMIIWLVTAIHFNRKYNKLNSQQDFIKVESYQSGYQDAVYDLMVRPDSLQQTIIEEYVRKDKKGN